MPRPTLAGPINLPESRRWPHCNAPTLVQEAPAMDRIHEEFVALFAAVEEAKDFALLRRW